jgi:predicted nucleic acid-binding Zn ribbon protein
MKDDALRVCPKCGEPVHRLISRTFVSTPKTNSELKGMGFTKLVRRDKGVYENVTATNKESRYMLADKPETMPDLKRKISD